MSYTYDIDYTLWEAYLADCKAHNIKPSLKDYQLFLQEADLDRAENAQGEDDEWEED